MKRVFWAGCALWLFACCFVICSNAFGQNATVTANVKQLSGGASQPTGASIRVDLQNCTAPRVPGTGNIGEKSRTFYPNSSGIATVTLFSNTVIDCGSGVPSTPVSFYTFNLVSNGQVTSLGSYKVPVGASTLDTLTPINSTPVVPTPSGDDTYLRLDLGNFSNLIQPIPHLDISGLLTSLTATIPQINSVVNAMSYASLNAAVAACPLGAGCTVDINSTIGLSASLTVPSTVTLRFNQPGEVNLNGFTLTTASVVAAPFQIFTNGPVILGSQVSQVPVEWFGAVGDWNGATGTDNTAAIQAAINALSGGQILLRGQTYLVSSALVIHKSSVGIAGIGTKITSPTLYANPVASAIISNNPSGDIVTVAGASPSQNVAFNKFNDFTLQRSVLPTGTSAGLALNYTYGVEVRRVTVEDSIRGIYVHSSGSQGDGMLEDVAITDGYNGLTETSSVYGIYMDSGDGLASNSFRIRHSFFVPKTTITATTYGLYYNGSGTNDQMVYGWETAHASYGVYINYTGGGPTIATQDMHFYGSVIDDFGIAGFYIHNVQSPQSGRVEISGGWVSSLRSGTSAIDIEACNGIVVTNLQIGQIGSTLNNAIDVNNSQSITLANNSIFDITQDGIVLINTSMTSVTGNHLTGSPTGALIRLQNSVDNAVGLNTLLAYPGAVGGLYLDATSTGNTGLDTNAFMGTFTNVVFMGTPNPFTFFGSIAPAGACSNGNLYRNQATLTGTYPYYVCRNSVWVGQGTVY